MSEDISYAYIDSNIILDVVRNRKKESILFFEKIRNNEIKACTSLFCLLELIDKEQEYIYEWKMLRNGHSLDDILRKRNQRNLNDHELSEAFDKIDRIFVTPYKKSIDLYYLEGTGWDKAVELMQTLNLRSNDAVHLATALMAGCNVLVSNDQEFLKSAKKVIHVCTPENIDQTLKELKK